MSAYHKNINLAHIFKSINDRALIFGMHESCDKPFLLVSWGDLDLWPSSRSNLLPGAGPQFFEFACLSTNSVRQVWLFILKKFLHYLAKRFWTFFSSIVTLYVFTGTPSGYPQITRTPALTVVEKGRQATLRCAAAGDNVQIQWLKDYVPLDVDQNPRLTILPGGANWLVLESFLYFIK